jgi:hypothetical protein
LFWCKTLLELQSTLQGMKILLNSSVVPHTSYDVTSGIGIVGADSIGHRSGIVLILIGTSGIILQLKNAWEMSPKIIPMLTIL